VISCSSLAFSAHQSAEDAGFRLHVTSHRERHMSVAKITEIQSSSTKSFDDALRAGIARANKTLKNLTGAWIKGQKVVITDGKITEYRVLLKVTFVLTD
jgi:dodecin